MLTFVTLSSLMGPGLLCILGLFPGSIANRHVATLNKLAGATAIAVLASAASAAAAFLGLDSPLEQHIGGITVYLDALSISMLLLVAFIGAVVINYSRHYLDGEPQQGRFIKWLALTVGSVLLLVISGNLIQFTLCWMATSLCLHQLLLFYPDRPAARLAAHKKFVISRIGDICLIIAMFAIYQSFGSLSFGAIFENAHAQQLATLNGTAYSSGFMLHLAGFGLVLGAALKSAQFPFHSWLPEVMETPTPVSALMHAGIINAGGFLVIRMSHVLTLTPAALNVLAVIGSVTALFGSLVMLTQTSIKKSLAFSTVGQMGFMMLQCGLGAFSSALLHIVAHALYKAHAFLSSGSTVEIAKAAWQAPVRTERSANELGLAFALALLVTLATATLLGVSIGEEPGIVMMGAILQLALTYLLWNTLESRADAAQIVKALGLVIAVSMLYFALQTGFMQLFQDSLAVAPPLGGGFHVLLLITVLLGFTGVLLLQTQFPGTSANRIWQAAYVHFYNGFYISALANRLLKRYWPAPNYKHPNQP